MKIFSAAQIREADARTIAHEPISGLELMERAAAACVAWIKDHTPTATPVHIFCGMGNNGGDGLAIARLLHDEGYNPDAHIIFYGDNFSADCLANKTRLEHYYGFPLHAIHEIKDFPAVLPEGAVIIDAVFGTGLSRPVEGLAAGVIEKINERRKDHLLLSIDIPSGMFAGKTSVSQIRIQAAFTLTFEFYKLAFLLPENADSTGEVIILPIGIDPGYILDTPTPYRITDEEALRSVYRPRKPFSHKGNYGHALLVAGSEGKMGAAVLAAKACLRSGAGLVSCSVPAEGIIVLQTAAPEAMVIPRKEEEKVPDGIPDKFTTAGIGPGLGTDRSAKVLLAGLLGSGQQPVVLDADALNLLAAHPGLMDKVPAHSILTPHPKEFERLFGRTENDFDRLALLREQSQKHGWYILLKGRYSCLSGPDGACWFNPTGNPGMATGGSGDVLTGILTGLLAQGYSTREAGILGMYLHGMAGDIAAMHRSQEAMIAGDIVENLGEAFKFLHKI